MKKELFITVWLLVAVILITAFLYALTLNWYIEKEVYTEYVYPLTYDTIDNWVNWITYRADPGFIRPVYILTLYPNVKIFGYSPWGFRLFNWLFHVANLLLVFALGRLLLKNSWWALLAATLFAFHPNIASVQIYVLYRGAQIATFFTLCGLLTWSKYLLTERYRIKWLVLTLLFYLLTIFSKEIAFPFILLALALHVTLIFISTSSKATFRSALPGYTAIVLLSLAYAIYRVSALSGVGGYEGTGHISFGLLTLRNILKIMNGAFFIEHGRKTFSETFSVAWVFGSIIASAITLVGLWPKQRGSRHWVINFGFIYLFLGSISLFNWHWRDFWRLYYPLTGFSIGLAGLFMIAVEKFQKRRKLILGTAILLPFLMILLTVFQIRGYAKIFEPRNRLYQEIMDKHYPLPGTHLYVYHSLNGQRLLERFTCCIDPATYKEDLVHPYRPILLMTDGPNGTILIGTRIHLPYFTPRNPIGTRTLSHRIDFRPCDRALQLNYENGTPKLSLLDQETLKALFPEIFGTNGPMR